MSPLLRSCALVVITILVPWARADTLVVCPAAWQLQLAPWLAHRTAQGHAIDVVDTPTSAGAIEKVVRRRAGQGGLRYVLFVGDIDRLATHYVPAKVNVRWGSTAEIASDGPFADVDGDHAPDVVVARLPVDSASELRTVLAKVIRYETTTRAQRERIDAVASSGGFGAAIDGVIEMASRQLMAVFVPADVPVSITQPGLGDAQSSTSQTIRRQLAGDALAWVYLGHGHPTALEAVHPLNGRRSLLSVDDLRESPLGGLQSLRRNPKDPSPPRLTRLASSPQATRRGDPADGGGGLDSVGPLAVLVACYTGAMDAERDCLAEELLTQPAGPVAVVAASRVSMPYGNAVLGCELLRGCFDDRTAMVGDLWLAAQRRSLAPAGDDPLRTSLDQLARGLMPPPVDLATERREHVAMYHLLGDPLLRLPPLESDQSDIRIAELPGGPKQSRER